jgi:hypothetical protein
MILTLTLIAVPVTAACSSPAPSSPATTSVTTSVSAPVTPPASSASPELQAVGIVSLSGPLSPINPGGPKVKITLQNIGGEPLISLTASLSINSALNKPYEFSFAVSKEQPLAPNASISSTQTLIGGGFSNDQAYPLTVSGTWQNGNTFSFTQPGKISPPG